MAERRTPEDHLNLLADIAEMYYLQGKNQQEISEVVGVTRSMVSRMLTEAYKKGVFTIKINRPMQFDPALANQLEQRFGLVAAHVVQISSKEYRKTLPALLGKAGAQTLISHLKPGTVLGLTWGSSVTAVIDNLEVEQPVPVKVVQLTGALGVQNNAYNGQSLAQRLAENLDGEGFFLNAPFICPTIEVAESLIESPGVQEVINLGKKADVLLAGVGSIDPKQSSLYRSGYFTLADLNYLAEQGTVGDVCGRIFDVHGRRIAAGYGSRLITIQTKDLLSIPTRIGVAGGPKKVEPILGALRGGYINLLVTDSVTAAAVLEQSNQ
jgi:DNA-binding transcriptional regulator LsrR (DeoR family)